MPAQPKEKSHQDTVRRKLAKTLLGLRLRHAKLFDEIDGLKAALIAGATKAGEGFREVFDHMGQVTVAAAKAKECRGNRLEVNVAAFNALAEARRQKLLDDGLILELEDWSRDFHGRVDVKTFQA